MNNFAQSFDPEAPVPESVSSISQTLDDIDSLLSKFLVCSTPQRAILALWIVHTYCYRAFPVTPYLEIHSPEKQSGKTVCLRLLQFVSNNAWSSCRQPRPLDHSHRQLSTHPCSSNAIGVEKPVTAVTTRNRNRQYSCGL
jgi:hypothetical protein